VPELRSLRLVKVQLTAALANLIGVAHTQCCQGSVNTGRASRVLDPRTVQRIDQHLLIKAR
jgi:hypothetical protein